MSRVVILLMAIGCGTPPRPAPPAPAPAPSHTFVEVELGLDLRALPTHSRPDMIDMYVLGQGDDLRKLAPAGVDVEIRHVPGAGVLYARFRAPDPAVTRAACTRTVTAYLAQAPDLPVIHTPGVQMTTPCHDASE